MTSPERLAAELEDAFRNRALLYLNLYQELSAELGPERAEALLGRAIYARGRAVAEAHYGGFGPQDAEKVADAFLSVSPNGGAMYPTDVTRRDDGSVTIAVRRCPLKDAWRDAGIDDAMLTTLCRIAGRFDNGLFETTGVGFASQTWCAGREGCCTLHLSPAG
jgi:hypothetical protein